MSADNSSANKRIAKNSVLLSVRMVIVLLISLYTTRAVLSLLGVEDYGVYNVVCGFVGMFSFLSTTMGGSIQRFYNVELGKNGEDGARLVFNTAFRIQLLFAVISVLLCEVVGLWYLHEKMVIPSDRMFAAEWIFQFSMATFFFTMMQAPYSAAVMAHEKMDFYAVINVVDVVLKLLIVFIIPYLEGDYLILYGLFIALISVFDIIWYIIYCKKNFKEIVFAGGHDKLTFRDMLSFSGWNMFGSLSQILREQGINLIMNLFWGPVVNAARGVANQVNGAINGFVTNILTPVRPQVIQSYVEGNLNRSFHLTYSVSKVSIMFFYMMALPISLEIGYILKLWLGENVPEHSGSFVILVLLNTAVTILMGAMATMVHASGDMKKYQIVGFIIKTLSVPAGYFLLKFGSAPEIALFMVFLFDFIGYVVGLFIIRSIMPFSIKDYIKSVALPLFPVLVLPFIITLPLCYFLESGFVRLLVVMFIGVLSVATCSWWFGFNKSEKEMVRAFVNTTKKRFHHK